MKCWKESLRWMRLAQTTFNSGRKLGGEGESSFESDFCAEYGLVMAAEYTRIYHQKCLYKESKW
ncbi:hypothetical protein LR48_Vigan05g081900 [Vigna angularis]|uniref:Uncharacterized protein n=1 Tax=Phaseolus angularis TaxID=3914 RepID=A0A0L9UK04_PHAAN|nr:hypothetical protein LR48_Vigan05g081900 [Vigna angularis]